MQKYSDLVGSTYSFVYRVRDIQSTSTESVEITERRGGPLYNMHVRLTNH